MTTMNGRMPDNAGWLRSARQHLSPSETIVTDRRAALFRNGRNQAVRIPREIEMAGSEVLIRKDGDSLVLTPVRQNKLRDLLASWELMGDLLPEVEDLPPQAPDAL